MRWPDIWPLIPMFVLGIGLAGFTAIWEKVHIGSVGAAWNYSLVDRCLIAGRALLFYPAKLLCPTRITFSYPLWKIDAGAWWQYLYPVVAAAIAGALVLWRNRIGRGVVAAVLIFIAVISPALGFIDYFTMRYSLVADHYQYLACISLIALVAHGAARVFGERSVIVKRLLGAALLAVLMMLSFQQAGMYRDARTLWVDTIGKNPQSWFAHTNLGIIESESNQMDLAIDHLKQALALKSDELQIYANLGGVLANAGRTDEATRVLEAGVAMPVKPGENYMRAVMSSTLGVIAARQGRAQDARRYFQQAIDMDPNFAVGHAYLAHVQMKAGEVASAQDHARRALEIDPENLLARQVLEQLTAATTSAPATTHSHQ
jgi:Tfp pilus assembly protein PilF